MVVSFIGGENWSTQRKPPTCRNCLYALYYYGYMTKKNIKYQLQRNVHKPQSEQTKQHQ